MTAKHEPQLLVVPGLPRCATTAFLNVLTQHPDIAPGRQKEPHFFLPSSVKSQGYSLERTGKQLPLQRLGFCLTEKQFKDNYEHSSARYQVDGSTLYSLFPQSVDVLAESGNRPRFIVLFRGAFKRSLSHYLFSVSRGEEHRGFDEALEDELAGRHANWILQGYMKGSGIRGIVQAIQQRFGEDSLLLFDIDSQEIMSPPVFDEVCDFLGLSRVEFGFDVYRNTSNASKFPKARIMARKIRQLNPALLDNSFTRPVFNWFMEKFSYAPERQTEYSETEKKYADYFEKIDAENRSIYQKHMSGKKPG